MKKNFKDNNTNDLRCQLGRLLCLFIILKVFLALTFCVFLFVCQLIILFRLEKAPLSIGSELATRDRTLFKIYTQAFTYPNNRQVEQGSIHKFYFSKSLYYNNKYTVTDFSEKFYTLNSNNNYIKPPRIKTKRENLFPLLAAYDEENEEIPNAPIPIIPSISSRSETRRKVNDIRKVNNQTMTTKIYEKKPRTKDERKRKVGNQQHKKQEIGTVNASLDPLEEFLTIPAEHIRAGKASLINNDFAISSKLEAIQRNPAQEISKNDLSSIPQGNRLSRKKKTHVNISDSRTSIIHREIKQTKKESLLGDQSGKPLSSIPVSENGVFPIPETNLEGQALDVSSVTVAKKKKVSTGKKYNPSNQEATAKYTSENEKLLSDSSFSSSSFQDDINDGNQRSDDGFVSMFRDSAPYISMHRGTTMVIHLSSQLFDTDDHDMNLNGMTNPLDTAAKPPKIAQPKDLDKLLDDVAQMSLLGIKIVLVAGLSTQVDKRLRDMNIIPQYCGDTRITDDRSLRIIKEEMGFIRCEIESQLSRGFGKHGKPGAMGLNVVSGNFFYTAKPYGVIEGIDFGYTGEIRKIEVEKINQRLNQGDIVLLTTLGYSASGETFNVVSEVLASETASALQASKLIFMTGGQSLIDSRTDSIIHHLRLRDAKALLEYNNFALFPSLLTQECSISYEEEEMDFMTNTEEKVITPRDENNEASAPNLYSSNRDKVEAGDDKDDDNMKIQGKISVLQLSDKRPSVANDITSVLYFCRYAVQALTKGVKRAHLIAPGDGWLLKEIFTRDGSGTLISRDLYDGIRMSTVEDVPGIMDIIQPLINDGILARRSKSGLEKDSNQYYVFVREGFVLACGQIKYWEDWAEIGCLAVHPEYRKGGRGEAMLGYLERVVISQGRSKVFVLSTRTMQWFLERGFKEVDVSVLPESRKSVYNWQRKSKIYMKELKTHRDVDAEELFWT